MGEMDVVLIAPGQNVKLEVDAFKNRKFTGTVTEIANSSEGSNVPGLSSSSSSSSTGDATKFEVKIRIKEKEAFRPGMSVTANIETRSRTNVLTVPFASVTTRLPKSKDKKPEKKLAFNEPSDSKVLARTNSPASSTNALAASTNSASDTETNLAKGDKKGKENLKPIEVVFILAGDHVKMAPVKTGIGDDNYWEIIDGVQEGQEVVSGGNRAISRDLEDGKKVRKGTVVEEKKTE